MTKLEVVKIGDDILRGKAQTVKRFNEALHTLLNNMSETMYEEDGCGLAAPQVGISKRVIVVDDGAGLHEIINPEIVEGSGEEIDQEGCLSIPGRNGYVPRMTQVRVQGQDRFGRDIEVIGDTPLLARALQHEIDHLEGILFVDKLVAPPPEAEQPKKQVKAKIKTKTEPNGRRG